MADALRSVKLWLYLMIIMIVALMSFIAYAYYRDGRIREAVEGLKSDDPEVVRTATVSLREMGSDTINYLIPAIKDMDARSRGHAADALRQVSLAVPALVAVLNDKNEKDAAVRAASADVLGKMGAAAKDSVPDLAAALGDEDESVRVAAAMALGEIKDGRAIEPLVAAFGRQYPGGASTEEAVEGALVKIGPDAVPALIKALQSDVPRIREASAEVIGRMGPIAKDSVPSLIEAIKDKDGDVRERAKWALGEIGDPRAVDPLIATFYRDRSTDNAALKALGRIGVEAVPPLVTKLKDVRDNIRELSATALGHVGPAASDAVPSLIILLNDRSNQVRRQAILALGRIKEGRAVQPLTILLKKQTLPDVVVEALGEIGPAAKDAVPLLWERLWEENLHKAAVTALKKITPESTDKIIYEEQAYASLEKAISSIELLDPVWEGNLTGEDGSPTKIIVTFKWKLTKPKPEVVFCSTVMTDKGENPFDGWYANQFHAGRDTQVVASLNYGEYHNYFFEWGVKVIACRDAGVRCDKQGACLGRTFISKRDKYSAE